jgi:hypothetical protein
MIEVVTVKSAWASQTNWAQALALVAILLNNMGINIPPEMQVKILEGVIAFVSIFTMIRRTFFTRTVTPSVAASLIL